MCRETFGAEWPARPAQPCNTPPAHRIQHKAFASTAVQSLENISGVRQTAILTHTHKQLTPENFHCPLFCLASVLITFCYSVKSLNEKQKSGGLKKHQQKMWIFVCLIHFDFKKHKQTWLQRSLFSAWFSSSSSSGGQTTSVRGRVMGYKVTGMHLSPPRLHRTAGHLITSQGGFTLSIIDTAVADL